MQPLFESSHAQQNARLSTRGEPDQIEIAREHERDLATRSQKPTLA